jgi:flavin reductase (DIM6/NTAB) family NADH-FMN oxidoreductase RutF
MYYTTAMERQRIDPANLHLPVYRSWNDEGFLLTGGDFQAGGYNTMTVGWGGLGRMWSRPMVMVVVRPQRHTRQFIDGFPDFTLSHFPAEHRDALSYCGSHSGRDVDKIRECGLTPIASREAGAPGFAEADLIIECRKMYYDDFKPEHFIASFIQTNYTSRDYHRMYLGEILAVFGAGQFVR